MASWKWAILFGLVVWLVPFVVAVCIQPLRDSARPLFESIMPVVLAVVVGRLGWFYFRRVQRAWMREGLILGVLWLGISVAIDLPLMLNPPMNMTLADYLADVGLTYVLMPIITTAMGAAAAQAARTSAPTG
ncbi:MAG: hypothetical protein HYS13_07300 [Planctomycetia bacterium]|nr:hypothetical protein [Planctomycetia bacterium]